MISDQSSTSDAHLRHISEPLTGRAMAVLLFVDLTLFLGLLLSAAVFVGIGGWLAASGVAEHPWLNLMVWHGRLAVWLPPLNPRPPAAVGNFLCFLVIAPTGWLSYLWIARRVGGRTLGQWLVPSKASSATVASRVACHVVFWCSAVLGAFYGPTILLLAGYTIVSVHWELWGWFTVQYGTVLAAVAYACVLALLGWRLVKTTISWRRVARWLTFSAYAPDERTLPRRGLGTFVASLLATKLVLCVIWQFAFVLQVYL